MICMGKTLEKEYEPKEQSVKTHIPHGLNTTAVLPAKRAIRRVAIRRCWWRCCCYFRQYWPFTTIANHYKYPSVAKCQAMCAIEWVFDIKVAVCCSSYYRYLAELHFTLECGMRREGSEEQFGSRIFCIEKLYFHSKRVFFFDSLRKNPVDFERRAKRRRHFESLHRKTYWRSSIYRRGKFPFFTFFEINGLRLIAIQGWYWQKISTLKRINAGVFLVLCSKYGSKLLLNGIVANQNILRNYLYSEITDWLMINVQMKELNLEPWN